MEAEGNKVARARKRSPPNPTAIVIPGVGERSEPETRNPAAPKAICSRTVPATASRSRAPLGSGSRDARPE